MGCIVSGIRKGRAGAGTGTGIAIGGGGGTGTGIVITGGDTGATVGNGILGPGCKPGSGIDGRGVVRNIETGFGGAILTYNGTPVGDTTSGLFVDAGDVGNALSGPSVMASGTAGTSGGDVRLITALSNDAVLSICAHPSLGDEVARGPEEEGCSMKTPGGSTVVMIGLNATRLVPVDMDSEEFEIVRSLRG
jgi:hypothetical protein